MRIKKSSKFTMNLNCLRLKPSAVCKMVVVFEFGAPTYPEGEEEFRLGKRIRPGSNDSDDDVGLFPG